MKKTVFIVLSVFLAIIVCIYMNYKQLLVNNTQAKKFNEDYEFYSKENILGTDITTLINKAIDNNEKYNISKDENGIYISDNQNSIKIYIHMIINDKTYSMEELLKAGINEFTTYFGEVQFKCSDIKYHEESGKISEMTFSATQN